MNINFKWIGGASWILMVNDLKIACDPVLCPKGTVQDYGLFKSIRLNDPIYDKYDFENIDLWLLTHGHEDHIDKQGLKVINEKSNIICNSNAFKKLSNNYSNISILKWNHIKEYSLKSFNITIKAVPAVHSVNPFAAVLAGNVNGYLIEIKNETENLSIYITSDTIINRKILNLFRKKKIDIIIPNMGGAKKSHILGPLTMTSNMLKTILNNLEYKIVLPVHFGTFRHYEESIDFVRKLNNKKIKILNPGDNFEIKI